MKNNILSKTVWLLCLLICAGGTKAQDSFINTGFNSFYFNPQNIGISTPQATDFMKYGNLNINHYNGLLDMEIELDGYKDNDFDLPMSIKYVSSGFVPTKRPSLVGYNWFLNFGGAVTRIVKGTPDDTKGKRSNNAREYLKDGLLVAIRNGSFKQYTETDLKKINVDLVSNNLYYLKDLKYDFEPDIFQFSFGRHSGRFIIGNNGTPISLSGDGYKIDISGLSVQEYSTTAIPVASVIKITTPDGYIYELGGNSTYIEYSLPNNPEKMVIKPRHITSWYLKSIQAPNNRKVQFEYESKNQPNSYNYFLYSSYSILTNTTCNDSIYYPPSNRINETSNQIIVTDNVSFPVIKKAVIDGGTEIRFDTVNGVSFFGGNDFTILLSSVSHYYNSVEVKKVTFNYKTFGKYIFLDNLLKNGQKYLFKYKIPETFPSPLTTSLDHWGYWNGGMDTKIQDVADYVHDYAARNTVINFYDIALLEKVIYPTGGMTEIIYEPNSYRRYLERNIKQLQIDLKENATEIYCGGARVKQLKDIESITNREVRVRDFQYVMPGTGAGSGVLGFKPKYIAFENVYQYTTDIRCRYDYHITYKDISSNSLGFNENLPECHIGYSDVIEKFSNNGSIHYRYSSNADIPNTIEDREVLLGGVPKGFWGHTKATVTEILEKSGMYVTNDLSAFRGKLLSKTTYNQLNKECERELYTYNMSTAESKCNISICSSARGVATYKLFLTPCLLEKKEVVDSNGVTYTEFYKYNPKSLLSEQRTINSNGHEASMNYKYVSDYSYNGLGSGEKSLFDKNMLSKPLKVMKTIHNSINTSPLVQAALAFNYKIENNIPVIDKIKELNTSTPVAENSTAFENGFFTKESYEGYDNYGNPTYIVRNDSLKTVYIWGYSGQHLIAEIKNATYSDVEAALGGRSVLNAITHNSRPNNTDWEMIMNLQNHAKLPDAHVSIYKHKPLIGISVVTDPAGFSTYYDYDSFGRLKETYIKEENADEDEKSVLESYEYHYKKQ